MKNFWIVLIVLIIGAANVYGQASCTWPLLSTTGTAVISTGNVNGLSESFSNLRINSYSGPYYVDPALPSQRVTLTSAYSAWITGPSDTVYAQFALSPNSGYNFYIDSVSLFIGQSGGGNMYALMRGSTDPNFTSDVQTLYVSWPDYVTGSSGGLAPILVSPGKMVQNGQTYYLRLYPWYKSSSTGKYLCLQNVVVSGYAELPGDSISISTNSLSSFNQYVGTPSIPQSYTLSGYSLSDNVTITAPDGFEISDDGGNNWYDSSSPVVLSQIGGSLLGQPVSISVRMNARLGGAFGGSILHQSANAIVKRISVSGYAIDSIAISTDLLTNFQHTIGTPSAPQSYTIAGYSLTDNVTITPPIGFEVSADSGTTWYTNSSPLVLNQTGGGFPGQPVPIEVRMNGPSTKMYSGNIMHTSTGAVSRTILVNGVTISLEPTVQSVLSFDSITGSSMTVHFAGGNGGRRVLIARAGADVTWAPTDASPVRGVDNSFLVAADKGDGNKPVYDGTGLSATITGLLSETSYHFASYEYNVGGINAQNYLIVSPGTGVQTTLYSPDTLMVSNTSYDYGTMTVHEVSSSQSCTVSGLNFIPSEGSLSIIAPDGFEVSNRSDVGFASSIAIPYKNSGLQPTAFYIRFMPKTAQFFNDSIRITGCGMDRHVNVYGTAVNTIIGGTYFVSLLGNDTNSGKFDQPFATIAHAIAVALAGDTIYVRGGKYSMTGTFTISKSGDVSHYYRLWAYPGERAGIDRSPDSASHNRGVTLSGSYWHLRGFDIFDAGSTGLTISGSYNIIEQCSVFRNGNTGLEISGGGSYNRILLCDSYWNYDWITSGGNADGFAPKMGVGTGNYFYGCRSWQNSDDGWDGYLRPADDVSDTLENCWSFLNGYLKDGTLCPGNGNGFKTGGSDNRNLRHNMVLKNCLAFMNKAKGFDQNNNLGSITMYNCTAYNNGIGTSGGHYNFSVPSALASGKVLTVKNSISLGSRGVSLENPVVATNSWPDTSTYPTDITSAVNADFISLDTAGVRGPRRSDGNLPVIDFMHLAMGSEFINAGVTIGLPYIGTAPDLGCFESDYTTGIVEEKNIRIEGFRLYQNYPNPFNPVTTIRFSIAKRGTTTLQIFNMLGQKVSTLFSGEAEPGRLYSVQFGGSSLSTGVYFSVLENGGHREVGKMILLK